MKRVIYGFVVMAVLLAMGGEGSPAGAGAGFLPRPRLSGPTWVTSAAYDRFHVVVSEEAEPEEIQAAEAFIAYWQRVTGHDIDRSHEPASDGVNVWIGDRGVPASLLGRVSRTGLGEDGFILHTVDGPPAHLLILGGSPRGVRNGAYHFIEQHLGVRWLTPEVTHIPPRPPSSISSIDLREIPAFRYRYTDYTEPWNGTDFEQAHRLRTPPMGISGHTVYELVPPEVYGGEHPEYFATGNWGRIIPQGFDWRDPADREQHPYQVGQLNFTHPDIPALLLEALRERIEASPDGRIWSVSQMDWEGYDQGPQSAAIDAREDSPMGSLLTGINRLADLMADEFPGHFVETMAHDWSRTPPTTLEPQENVVIRLTTMGTDSARPLSDSRSELNREFLADLEGWAAQADTLFVTYFVANQRNFQAPYPNLHVLQDNLKLFAEHGVEGVLAQGSPSPGSELGHLRTYLLVKAMWDPATDLDAHKEEFLRLYYGEAAPAIQDYIELIRTRVIDNDVILEVRDELQWMNFDTVLQTESLFRTALDAAESDDIRRRVEEAYIPVQYATLVCPPRITVTPTRFTLVRPPGMALNHYMDVLRDFGVTQVESGWPLERIAQQIGGSTPPRMRQYALERLESNQYHIWLVPEAAGSVIRFQHLPSGTDLLVGYRTFEASPGTFQEWLHAPGTVERPIAERYEVARRTFDSITLRTVLPDGLQVDRQMTLRRQSDGLQVQLTLTNPTDAPITPQVKLHPEFHAPAAETPEIWAEQGNRWVRINVGEDETAFRKGETVDPGTYNRWAVWFPSRRLTLLNTFNPDEVESLFYYYDVHPGLEHVNLELVAPTEPLEPGQSRTITTTYEISTRSPSRL